MRKLKMTDYERARNELIPMAELHADTVAGEARPDDNFESWTTRWNRAFLGEMARLARLAGLVR